MSNEIVQASVELVAQTVFQVPASVRQQYNLTKDRDIFTDVDYDAPGAPRGMDPVAMVETGNGEDLAEFAGRACYESWDRPSARTATNEGYLAHILAVGHGSVLEHAVLTYYIRGVSRSLTHELVRHRAGFGFSQLSQRYVDAADAGIVIPPEMRDDEFAVGLLRKAMQQAVITYETLVQWMEAVLETQGVKGTEARKRARQAARAVMPNMTETRIVVTANVRAWRHFVTLRGTTAADTEIRELALLIFENLQEVVPNMVQDLHVVTKDGMKLIEEVSDT